MEIALRQAVPVSHKINDITRSHDQNRIRRIIQGKRAATHLIQMYIHDIAQL
jgi:hypothetical protein